MKFTKIHPAETELSHVDSPQLDYFAYFHFIMFYESILWQNSTAKETFTIQKKIADLDDSQV